MKYKNLLLIIILTFVFSANVFAQVGHYIMPWGGGQQTWLLNRDDYSSFGTRITGPGDRITLENTYRYAAGIDYFYNFDTIFGIQTGVVFSRQGQKYSGTVARAIDTMNNLEFNDYTSQVLMDYIKVPLLFRFNSYLEDYERVNMSLFAGMYIGYRWRVTDVSTNPGHDSLHLPSPDFNDYFKRLDAGFSAGAQLNVLLNRFISATIGLRYDRGFVDIEKKRVDIARNSPAEWYFPLSTKKYIIPARADAFTRLPTRNTTVNIFLGFAIRLAD